MTVLRSQPMAAMFNENVSKDIKALAYEKSIDVERVFGALEDALSTAARKYYKTREPFMPTQAPTGSTSRSREVTAILARSPGSRTASLITTVPS